MINLLPHALAQRSSVHPTTGSASAFDLVAELTEATEEVPTEPREQSNRPANSHEHRQVGRVRLSVSPSSWPNATALPRVLLGSRETLA